MRYFRRSRTRKAFTFIEAIIALAINSAVTIMAVKLCTTCYWIQAETSMYNSTDAQARITASLISNDLRSAAAIAPTYVDGSNTFTNSTSTLILHLPPVDSNGTAIAGSTEFDRVVYHQATNRRIWRSLFPAAGSSRQREDRILGPSDTPSIALFGSYAQQPDALGCYLVTYSITCNRTCWRTTQRTSLFTSTVDGTIRLRNRSV
jgi:hypothetical protein